MIVEAGLRPASGPAARTRTTGLPPDLLAQSAKRLRTLALLYAFCFAMSDVLPMLLFQTQRDYAFAAAIRWVPTAVSIVVALIVAASTWSPRVAVGTALTLGLIFEVVGSFGIAISQYGDPTGYVQSPPWAGLSWVAVWMLAYTVIVPSPPRQALIAALISVSSVPIVVGLGVANGAAAPPIDRFRVLSRARAAIPARRSAGVRRRPRGLRSRRGGHART